MCVKVCNVSVNVYNVVHEEHQKGTRTILVYTYDQVREPTDYVTVHADIPSAVLYGIMLL